MNQLDWLNQHRLIQIVRRETDWVFSFSGNVILTVACLWRLIENQRIRLTNFDDGQQFGLPSPLDVERRLNELPGDGRTVTIDLRDGTLDLRLTFDDGYSIEIIPDSSGYEAWTLQRLDQQFIAVGGGNLYIINGDNRNRA